MRWYAVERGRPTARAIRSSGTGSVWLARKRSTRSARAAAGTWLIATLPVVRPSGHRRRGGADGFPAWAGIPALGGRCISHQVTASPSGRGFRPRLVAVRGHALVGVRARVRPLGRGDGAGGGLRGVVVV